MLRSANEISRCAPQLYHRLFSKKIDQSSRVISSFKRNESLKKYLKISAYYLYTLYTHYVFSHLYLLQQIKSKRKVICARMIRASNIAE